MTFASMTFASMTFASMTFASMTFASMTFASQPCQSEDRPYLHLVGSSLCGLKGCPGQRFDGTLYKTEHMVVWMKGNYGITEDDRAGSKANGECMGGHENARF
ncbi:hypothetical protein EV426DRAFT_700501 [Tirmania nivea]|nr:hypothetical protein EV426DRAFT_700501 [Tirmania nivea]